MSPYSHISFYKFVKIEKPEALREQLMLFCKARGLKGTVLIAPEGFNGMLAGEASAIAQFEIYFSSELQYQDVHFKKSESHVPPFKRLLIKVKNQILTLRSCDLEFPFTAAPYIQPEELNALLKSGSNLVLVDVRNGFEVDLGTFKNAQNPQMKNFSEFPDFARRRLKTLETQEDSKIITFCTGGIRCEKASAILLREGFKNVFQLEGGLLNYFAKTDGAGFEGQCFVFDERVALEKDLTHVRNPS